MPGSIGPILMLWSGLLLVGIAAGPRPGVESIPASRHASPIAIASHPIATFEAMPPSRAWPWRISEADTTEDDSIEGGSLGPWRDGLPRGRLFGDRGTPSPIRDDRGSVCLSSRSPILRC